MPWGRYLSETGGDLPVEYDRAHLEALGTGLLLLGLAEEAGLLGAGGLGLAVGGSKLMANDKRQGANRRDRRRYTCCCCCDCCCWPEPAWGWPNRSAA